MSPLLTALLLSGCLGGTAPSDDLDPQLGPTDAPAPPPEAGSSGRNATEDATRVPLRFALAEPVDRVAWVNGSFAPEETGAGGGFLTGAFVKEIDLSDLLPEEVPARIGLVVTVDAEEVPVAGPTARADPVSNGTVWYEGAWRQLAAGHYALDAVLKRGAAGTFGVALEAYTPAPMDPAHVTYSVRLHVTAHPERIPVGVPVAIALDANETLTFDSGGAEAAEVLVHGPDDRLVDRLYFAGATEWTVPAGRGGEYVVLPIRGEGLGLGAVGAAGGLRPLTLARETGDAHAVAPMETTTWAFDLDQRPLRIVLGVRGPSGTPWACSGSLDVRLEAPEGTLLERTTACPSPTNVPFLYGDGRTWASDLGDPRLTTGTYTATFENTLWYGHEAYQIVETYVR